MDIGWQSPNAKAVCMELQALCLTVIALLPVPGVHSLGSPSSADAVSAVEAAPAAAAGWFHPLP